MTEVIEHLVCLIGGGEYGIDVQRVQEIRYYQQPTRIPNAPTFVKGVINIRGVIVPIIDLRLKLSCPDDINPLTSVVVLNIRKRIIGAVVDSVSDVVGLREEQIKPVGEYPFDKAFIVSTATVGERAILIMDISGLMSVSDMELLESI